MSRALERMNAREIVWATSGATTPLDVRIAPDPFNPYAASLRKVEDKLLLLLGMSAAESAEQAADEYDVCRTINDAAVHDKRELRNHYEVLLGQVDDLPLTPDHSYAKANARARLRCAITEECNTTWEDKHEPQLQTGGEWATTELRRLTTEQSYLLTRLADYEYDQGRRVQRLEGLRLQLGGKP